MDCGDRRKPRGFEIVQPACNLIRLKTRGGDNRSPGMKGCEEAAYQPMYVKEWHQVETTVCWSEVQGSRNGSSIPADAILPEWHPFRFPSGAGSMKDKGGVFRVRIRLDRGYHGIVCVHLSINRGCAKEYLFDWPELVAGDT